MITAILITLYYSTLFYYLLFNYFIIIKNNSNMMCVDLIHSNRNFSILKYKITLL